MSFSLSKLLHGNDDRRQTSSDAYRRLYDEVKRLVNLEVENARLILTERLTLLFGRVAIVAVSFVLSACVVIFLSMSISDLLLGSLTPWATYMIVGGFYVLLIIILCIFRRQLIINPIARYLSKILLEPRPSRRSKGGESDNAASENAD